MTAPLKAAIGCGLAVLIAGAAAATAALREQPRPFRHAEHEALSCQECHPAGERHRAPMQWTPQVCASCHHDPARGLACATCHAPADYEPTRAVPTALDLTVWADAPRIRALPFDHELHESITCAECHRTGVLLAPPTCVSCHMDHHRPEALCTTCHLPMPPEVHELRAHITCTGAGCHSSDPDRRPAHTQSRNLCLLCHVDMTDHEPGGICYSCHQVPPLRDP